MPWTKPRKRNVAHEESSAPHAQMGTQKRNFSNGCFKRWEGICEKKSLLGEVRKSTTYIKTNREIRLITMYSEGNIS